MKTCRRFVVGIDELGLIVEENQLASVERDVGDCDPDHIDAG